MKFLLNIIAEHPLDLYFHVQKFTLSSHPDGWEPPQKKCKSPPMYDPHHQCMTQNGTLHSAADGANSLD